MSTSCPSGGTDGGGLQRVQLAAMVEDIQDLFAWLGAPLTEITSCEGEKLMKLLLRAEGEVKWGGKCEGAARRVCM